MNSYLVKIASVAVMFHMTFGCSMHHGIWQDACGHQHAKECDHEAGLRSHDDIHDHDHDHHEPRGSEPTDAFDSHSHSSNHLGCSDDGCNVTRPNQSKFKTTDSAVPYLGGLGTLALLEGHGDSRVDIDLFPDRWHVSEGVRAHLLFGVQIL